MIRLALFLSALALSACTAPQADGDFLHSKTRFPEDWIGVWKGPVQVFQGSESGQGFHMSLEIAPTPEPSRYVWTLRYEGESGSQTRPYELIARNRELGRYAIDEKNGIVLEARYLGDTLYTWFEIGGAMLTTRERLCNFGTKDEAICFELLSAPTQTTQSGGGETTVDSFTPTTLQRARLRRVN
ncbi:MAG: hypothetical protein DWQ01_07590 [Planctomycetota bacterium]|nr:MAG: hypothetical protein DWQ01_07590 [Planctomycetota bacterium]